MSRDEEADDLTEAGRRAVSEESVDMSKREPFMEAALPASRFAVFIASDGSATIDGVAVQAVSGKSLAETVLDTLHRHARERNSPVTAAISDPASEHVTFVEVAPDGSSKLLEHSGEPPSATPQEMADEGFGSTEPHERHGQTGEAKSSDSDAAPFEDFRNGEGDDSGSPDNLLGGPDDDLTPSRLSLSLPSLPRPSFSFRGPSSLLACRSKGSGARAETRQSDDEYRAPGLLHRPLVVGSVAFGAAALIIVPLIMIGGGSEGEGADNRAVGASDKVNRSPVSHDPTPAPAVSLTPSRQPPSSPASPAATPEPKDTERAKGATATVTIRPPQATITVTSKPTKGTVAASAATVVNRVAKDDPGRHICYRVYVSRRGWQKPVCDGQTSGTPGKGTVTAVNIAVSGTRGTSGSAYVYDPASTNGEGHFPKPWSDVPDGRDHYLGSTDKGAPHMLGFTINVDGGAGSVCQTTYVHADDWLSRACDEPGSGFGFTYAGTHDNDLWIEAIKLTV